MAKIEQLINILERVSELPVFDYRAVQTNINYILLDDTISPFVFASNGLMYEKTSKTVSFILDRPLTRELRFAVVDELTRNGFACSGFTGGFIEVGEYFDYYFEVRFFEDVDHD